MNYCIIEKGIITNIIVSDESFALSIGALPCSNDATIGSKYSKPNPLPTADEDRDTLLIDLKYEITLLQLGVSEGV